VAPVSVAPSLPAPRGGEPDCSPLRYAESAALGGRSAVRGGVEPAPAGRALGADARWMAVALAVGRAAAATADEVPVGAVLVAGDALVASSGNRSRRDGDATAHAELLVLRAGAAAVGGPILDQCTLYVTLEPCAMCAGAIILARVWRVVFGAWDDKAGMGGSVGDLLRHPRLNHRPQVAGGVMAEECGAVLTRFFAERRVESARTPPVLDRE
jgi:tRNA(adenine34) deaminase